MSGGASRGTSFGYAVHSPLAFRYLRGGSGEPLHVSESGVEPSWAHGPPLQSWTVTGDEPFHARLYRDGGRYALLIEGSGWFVVDPGAGRVSVPRGEEPLRREERLWGIPALLCFLRRGDVPLHAAAVEIDGRAVLLAAPRTFGKTTLAAALVRAGHRLLSEDLTCVRPSQVPSVVPGPAMLRLRADVGERIGLPGEWRLDGAGPRVRFAVPEPRRGDCLPVPVGAILFLRPATGGDGGVRVEPASPPDAVRDLFALSFRLPGEEEAARAFGCVTSLVAGVATHDLAYAPRLEALGALAERVAGVA